MANATVEDINAGMSEIVRSEVARSAPAEGALPSATLVSSQEAPVESARLPRRIPGGFDGVSSDLSLRAREWGMIVRILEQQKPLLVAAEAERDRLYERLARILPEVQESGSALKVQLEATKSGEVNGDLAGGFAKSLATLEELEDAAGALVANVVSIRTAWEQYARTIIRAQRLREDLKVVR